MGSTSLDQPANRPASVETVDHLRTIFDHLSTTPSTAHAPPWTTSGPPWVPQRQRPVCGPAPSRIAWARRAYAPDPASASWPDRPCGPDAPAAILPRSILPDSGSYPTGDKGGFAVEDGGGFGHRGEFLSGAVNCPRAAARGQGWFASAPVRQIKQAIVRPRRRSSAIDALGADSLRVLSEIETGPPAPMTSIRMNVGAPREPASSEPPHMERTHHFRHLV
jgi:hypothetical protein